MTKIIDGNTIIFKFNNPSVDEGDISEDFDFHKKPFVCTLGVSEIIDTKELKNYTKNIDDDFLIDSFKQKIIGEIISTIYERAKYIRLDYLQKLSINSTDCWIIDNGVDICLMLPSEY
ncbi:MAG: hypothetical protein PHI37_00540 [Candidatus Gracilibacteria bacterium]|nr:hypothetical protein [Candidatus Gracilibacteria bacterium]